MNLCYYINGAHEASGCPLGFSSSTFSYYYRLRFEIYDLDSELVIPGATDALSVSYVPFAGKVVRTEPLIAFEKDNEKVCSHKSVAQGLDIYWLRSLCHRLHPRRRPEI